jgi:hypothetical protein
MAKYMTDILREDDGQFRWIADEHRYTRLARIALIRVPSLRSYENEDDLARTIARAVGKWFADRGVTDPIELRRERPRQEPLT